MQVNLSQFVAGFCDSLAILGWMGMEGETNWWCAARSKWFADQYPDEYFRARSAKARSTDSDDLKSRGSDLSDSDDSSQGTSSENSSQRASSDEYYWDAEQLGVDDIEMRELGDSELAEIYDMVEVSRRRHRACLLTHTNIARTMTGTWLSTRTTGGGRQIDHGDALQGSTAKNLGGSCQNRARSITATQGNRII